jgi:hypothetical protein
MRGSIHPADRIDRDPSNHALRTMALRAALLLVMVPHSRVHVWRVRLSVFNLCSLPIQHGNSKLVELISQQ